MAETCEICGREKNAMSWLPGREWCGGPIDPDAMIECYRLGLERERAKTVQLTGENRNLADYSEHAHNLETELERERAARERAEANCKRAEARAGEAEREYAKTEVARRAAESALAQAHRVIAELTGAAAPRGEPAPEQWCTDACQHIGVGTWPHETRLEEDRGKIHTDDCGFFRCDHDHDPGECCTSGRPGVRCRVRSHAAAEPRAKGET